MPFLADLHVHSRFSRATSRDLDLERLAWWGARKGIAVVGTGDCVHPGWAAEIRDKLVAGEDGLFGLTPEIAAGVTATLPASCRTLPRFALTTEISTIYKKGDKTRKVHHLILLPDLAAADRLAAALGRIGNIASDGRPILGLDSRDLLEIVLGTGPLSTLVPAHIWTPWFAALGSQSGFDSIAECYGDLADHIVAVETGLSSDPAMNWRVSSLDRYRLVSNSDAHSPAKLGREATAFSCAIDFAAMRRALASGEGYHGTIEFFPEEGKYHLDGHRACSVRLGPRETIALGGCCPVCGKPVTVGVAHRVEALADRESAQPPATAGTVRSLVPLPEILSELVGTGPASRSVAQAYDRVQAALGPELAVLDDLPIEDIAHVHPLLGEAIQRLRRGAVIREAGYDGDYGTIRLFADGELDRREHGALLFEAPRAARRTASRTTAAPAAEGAASPTPAVKPRTRRPRGKGALAGLDDDQTRAAALTEGPVLVIAGPGSGKTRMLTHRIAHLIEKHGVPAEACLAVTFTRRAAEEMRTRLAALLGERATGCPVHSFHSLGLAILRADGAAVGLAPGFRIADDAERKAALMAALDLGAAAAARLLKAVSAAKRGGIAVDEPAREAGAALTRIGREAGWVDFDDLVGLAATLLENDEAARKRWQDRFAYLSADEFQDIDAVQYRLLTLLAGPRANLCVIGDPDQAIYGFRGADAACFERFARDFPAAPTVRLGRNYRSSGTIVGAATGIVGRAGDTAAVRAAGEPVVVHAAADEADEAAFVAAAIAEMMGGHDLLAAGAAERPGAALGFGDFAVLYRTDAQAGPLRDALDRAGIPFGKSTPAPIAGHAGVVALLAALDRQDDAQRSGTLAARLEQAHEAARRADGADPVPLAEARGWLAALAAAPGIDEAIWRERIALSTEADFHDARAARVALLTMHAAKGLEFPVVFVVGMEDGLTPFSFPDAADDAARQAEERRLFYVAATRAMDRLILTRAAKRSWRGAVRTLAPSPFLDALPQALVTRAATPMRKPRPRQYSLF